MPVTDQKSWHLLWPRIALVVLIALLPATAITFYTFYDLRKSSYTVVQERLIGFTNIAAAQQEHFIEGARQFLVAISQIPAIRSLQNETCTATLTNLLQEHPIYLNISILDTKGNSVCGVFPSLQSIKTDRPLFHRTVTTKGFTIGSYQVDPLTRKPSIGVAHPVTDDQGQVGAVVMAMLSLEWFNKAALQAILPANTVLTIVDRNHTIVIRNPDPHQWVSLNIAHHPISLMLQQRRNGVARFLDLDGVMRLHAFRTLPGDGGLPGGYVRMSMDDAEIFADVYRNLQGNMLLLFMGALLSVLMAWLGSRVLIGHFIAEHERIDELKSEFISLASHQLRTPLTSIRWIIKAFLSGRIGTLSAPQIDLAKDAQRCADHMSATIRTLLLISCAELRTFTTHHAMVDILPLLEELRDEQGHFIGQKHLTVTIECSKELSMHTDREILREILGNLVSNAVRYVPDNGSIIVGAESKPGNRIQFTVNDTGYGIPIREQKRVFTKFFRGANVVKHQTDGSGLGLYLVRTLVGILGGTITFSSVENRGTTFSVILPFSSPSHA